MPKYKILQEGASYTFRSYCEMNAEPEDILSAFSNQFRSIGLTLQKSQPKRSKSIVLPHHSLVPIA